jgi:hypothetical protein
VAAGLDGLSDDPPLGSVTFSSTLGDWNGDEHLDLVVLQWYIDPLTAQLLKTPSVGQLDKPRSQCGMADERRAVASPNPPKASSHLFQNDGDGTFTDVTASMGVDIDQIIGMQPTFVDIDQDGWQDLFVTGDFCTSRLYRNDRGRFVDITKDAGVGTDENGMGSVIEDIDGDGILDWFVTSIAGYDGRCPDDNTLSCSGNRLYLGTDAKAPKFRDATDELGLRDASWAWGVAAQDFDDDGHRDVVVANGLSGAPNVGTSEPAPLRALHTDPTRFWRGKAGGSWTEEAEAVGLTDRTSGKALVSFDMDGDLDLDLLIIVDDAAPHLYRNETKRTDDRHRLVVRLRQPGKNPFAIGARLLVDLGDGTPPRRIDVKTSGSYGSSDPLDVHIGLGPVDRVRSIEVRWPGRTEPQTLEDVDADQVLTIERDD